MSALPGSTSEVMGGLAAFCDTGSSSNDVWKRLEAGRPAPLLFVLHPSRRPNASLCPCLQVELPTAPSTTHHTTTTAVTRILDPEHRIPYITLSPIFSATGLTLIQGLLRFQLNPTTAYDLSLAGLEPWDDLWVTLPLARHVAQELGMMPVLGRILDPRISLAWSLDEFGEGLSHNWRIPDEWLDAGSYSTDAMISEGLEFGYVEMLPKGQQIKTLIPDELRAEVRRRGRTREREREFRLHQKMVRWSSQLLEIWSDAGPVLELRSHRSEGEQQGGLDVEHERETLVKDLLEDLKGVTIPPTSIDMLEWMQLYSDTDRNPEQVPLASNSQERTPPPEQQLISPLSLAEMSNLRSDHFTFGDILLPAAQTEFDMDATIARLHSTLRAEISCLNRMNHLTLPILSTSKPPTLDEKASKMERHPKPGAFEESVQGQNGSPSGTEELVEELSRKVDAMSAKLDALIESNLGSNSKGKGESQSRSSVQRLSTMLDPSVSERQPSSDSNNVTILSYLILTSLGALTLSMLIKI